eukprot:CAMPEP_0174838570 /NCGR_PEP_ID=MMETSP1114-20130205/7476_1 /TAXON_ID=312471 /ORGANISM="Neobodo designis, Strain CCAP 1951/1" /LENGTH=722 /DNA_ID=CAMNT_0016072669 /DNA_START=70 /DNA_END=2238 /DNA_ORIENTATION=-
MATQQPQDATALVGQSFNQGGWHMKLGDRLGAGAFGTVYHACTLPDDDGKYAVKVVAVDANNKAYVEREAALSYHMNHPNVVKTHAALYDVPIGAQGHRYTVFIMERCDCSLARLLHHNGGLHEDVARDFMAQILDAVEHVHAQGVTHRDLKPDNILVAVDPATKKMTIKIADFGLAKAPTVFDPDVTRCGTEGYAAPEQFGDQPYDERVDLHPLGLILNAMLTGTGGPVTGAALAQMKPEVRAFIRATTCEDPSNRWSIGRLRNSEFMKGPQQQQAQTPHQQQPGTRPQRLRNVSPGHGDGESPFGTPRSNQGGNHGDAAAGGSPVEPSPGPPGPRGIRLSPRQPAASQDAAGLRRRNVASGNGVGDSPLASPRQTPVGGDADADDAGGRVVPVDPFGGEEDVVGTDLRLSADAWRSMRYLVPSLKSGIVVFVIPFFLWLIFRALPSLSLSGTAVLFVAAVPFCVRYTPWLSEKGRDIHLKACRPFHGDRVRTPQELWAVRGNPCNHTLVPTTAVVAPFALVYGGYVAIDPNAIGEYALWAFYVCGSTYACTDRKAWKLACNWCLGLHKSTYFWLHFPPWIVGMFFAGYVTPDYYALSLGLAAGATVFCGAGMQHLHPPPPLPARDPARDKSQRVVCSPHALTLLFPSRRGVFFAYTAYAAALAAIVAANASHIGFFGNLLGWLAVGPLLLAVPANELCEWLLWTMQRCRAEAVASALEVV